MANKLICNIGSITSDGNSTPLFLAVDVNQSNLPFLCHIKRNGSSGSYTYEWWALNQSVFLTKRASGSAIITDTDVDVTKLANGYMSLILNGLPPSDGYGPVIIPNLTADATTYGKTAGIPTREIVGSGVIVTDYIGASAIVPTVPTTPVTPVTPITPVTPTNPTVTTKTPAQLEIERKKSFLYGVLAQFRTNQDGTSAGLLDTAINWILDNTILAIVIFVIAWNYVLVPQFFPTTTFLTWGDTKKNALALSKKKGNK